MNELKDPQRLNLESARKISLGSSATSGDRTECSGGFSDEDGTVVVENEDVVEDDDDVDDDNVVGGGSIRGRCRSSRAIAICSSTWSVYCLVTLSNRDATYRVSRSWSTLKKYYNGRVRMSAHILQDLENLHEKTMKRVVVTSVSSELMTSAIHFL